MKLKITILLLMIIGIISGQSLKPTIGAKYSGGISYKMEHEYFSGVAGLIYEPLNENKLFSNVKLSGEYLYDYQKEISKYENNYYVLRLQFSKPVNEMLYFTYYAGYFGTFHGKLMHDFSGKFKTNFSWGGGIQIVDDLLTFELLYENLAGYPHASAGIHFNLFELLK